MPPVQLSGYTMEPLDRTFQGYMPELKPQDGNRTLLVLRHAEEPAF